MEKGVAEGGLSPDKAGRLTVCLSCRALGRSRERGWAMKSVGARNPGVTPVGFS